MKKSTFAITGFVLLRLLGPIKILSDQLKSKYYTLVRNEINFRFSPKILIPNEDSLSFLSKLSL